MLAWVGASGSFLLEPTLGQITGVRGTSCWPGWLRVTVMHLEKYHRHFRNPTSMGGSAPKNPILNKILYNIIKCCMAPTVQWLVVLCSQL